MNLSRAFLASKVIGNTSLGTKNISESRTEIRTLLGDDALRGRRIAAGEILSLADLSAARSSLRYILGGGQTHSVATVAVDAVSFPKVCHHGDLMVLRSQVVHVGQTSMAVRVKCETDMGEGTRQHIATAMYHMVCIGKDLRPVAAVPSLALNTPEEQRWSETVVTRRYWLKQSQLPSGAFSSLQSQTDLMAEARRIVPDRVLVPMPSTEVVLHRIFFPGHVNFNNTVFGGEIMNWMERVAVTCGRRFALSENVHSIAMHNLSFQQPIYTTDWCSAKARIVYVRRTTMEVEVEVFVERAGLAPFLSHTAWFVVANVSRDVLPRGISVSESDPQSLSKYSHAALRYQFFSTNRKQTFE